MPDFEAFESEVRRSFAFLETDLGLRVESSNSTRVRYRSDSAYVDVYRDRGGEVGVELGRSTADPPAASDGFSIQEVMKAQGIPRQGRYPDLYAAKPEIMPIVLGKLAVLVREHAGPMLRSDPDLMTRLLDIRAAITRGEAP